MWLPSMDSTRVLSLMISKARSAKCIWQGCYHFCCWRIFIFLYSNLVEDPFCICTPSIRYVRLRDLDTLLKIYRIILDRATLIEQSYLNFLCIQLFVDLHDTSSCPLSLGISMELSFPVSWLHFSYRCCSTFSMHLWVCDCQQDPNPSLPLLQALILPLASPEASFLFKSSCFIKDTCLLFPFIFSCTDKFWDSNLIK